MSNAKPLPQSFFARPVDELARALLGCRLVRAAKTGGPIVMAITEVEAYAGPEDTASHARAGKTDRNAAMWGPAGHTYVYLCYGIHNMLNISADQPGRASAVLIRACEPIAGIDEIRRRRGGKKSSGKSSTGGSHGRETNPALLAGPGKVGAALQIDPSWSGHPLYLASEFHVVAGVPPSGVLVGPRVGIDYAEAADRARPWRFASADTACITRPSELRPE